MNFLKRAWLRLSSSLGKTITLIAVLFAICTLVLSGILIQSSAADAVEKAKEKVGATGTLKLEINGWMEKYGVESGGASGVQIDSSADLLTGKVDKIGEAGIAESFNYFTDAGGSPANGAKLYRVGPPQEPQSGLNVQLLAKGTRDSELLPEFARGDWKILDGKGISADSGDYDALIEERFAKENNLKVGDTFTMDGYEGGVPTGTRVTFTVSGIYQDPESSRASNPPYFEPGNGMVITIPAASELGGLNPGPDGSKIHEATFKLKNPDDLAALQQAAKDAGLDPKAFPITVNDRLYKALVGPINNTAGYATAMVWLVSIGGAVILGLIIASSIRERRREYGVLLSLGERKSKLIGQSLTEVWACTLIAIALAIPAATLLAQSGGPALLGNLIADAKANPALDPSQIDGGGGAEQADDPSSKAIDELPVVLSGSDIAKVSAAGFGIAGLGTLIPGIQIMRLRPREILSKGE